MLRDQIKSTEALKDDLLALQLAFNKSREEVGVLLTRNSSLVKRAKALAIRIRRAPTIQARAVEKVKAASQLHKLQQKGVITEASRELVTDLVSLHNVPVSRVLSVIQAVAATFGVAVDGDISERSVGRIVLEGGLISQAQIVHEIQSAADVTLSGDGTSLYNIQQESKFLNFKTSLYADGDVLHKRVHRFLGISTALDHTAETQIQGWKDINAEIHEVYNSTVGADNPVDPDTLPARATGYNGDHAPDQKKLGRGIGGEDGWKQQCDRKLRGEKELKSWHQDDLLPFIMRAAARKIESAGGMDAFNALPALEQDVLNKSMFVEICVDVGTDVFKAMSPEEQRETDLFIWAGCCMHKELNAVKGGNAAMIASWVGQQAPIRLMNKDNKAAADAGNSAAKTRAEAVSEGGGVKLTSLAGMLFHHKDKKKGEGALFHIWFEDKLGRSFTNVEKNVYDGLLDPATNTELLVLAAYGQAISRPYLGQVRGPNCEYTNVLDLGPLHARVKDHCRAIIANPDLLLAPGASYVKGSMDGRLWDNPEIMYRIQSIAATLPRVRECLVVFFAGALETWIRFSVDYEEGGTIANLTPAQRERANMPTTNDANEGTLGERRTGSRHAPNMSLHQHNARKMYKRNDTKSYRRCFLVPRTLRVFRAKARMVDSSGLTRRNRKAQQDFDTAAVAVKHTKDKVKVAKVKAVTAILDSLTPWLTAGRVRLDPVSQKEPTNKEMDLQLAWHRRAEGPLPKGTESEIPQISKLATKALKRDALIAAVHRFATRPNISSSQEQVEEDERVEDVVDSDVDMELGY
ncbi:hypothetical protein DFH06DRAFT_1095461 [Mycena polygramma]|nr:hypothetical protein DFH06DRAFT_1095461 [Mycena polygramma]